MGLNISSDDAKVIAALIVGWRLGKPSAPMLEKAYGDDKAKASEIIDLAVDLAEFIRLVEKTDASLA